MDDREWAAHRMREAGVLELHRAKERIDRDGAQPAGETVERIYAAMKALDPDSNNPCP